MATSAISRSQERERVSSPSIEIFPHCGVHALKSKGIRKFILRYLPKHVYMHLVTELHLMRVRISSPWVRRRYVKSVNLLVNVGAGLQAKTGWINVDGWEGPNINCVYDCRRSLPFPDGSVRAIFCEHFFEHIDYTEEVPDFLTECSRVLEKGGVLRLIVPDAEKYLRAYCSGGWDALTHLRPLTTEHEDWYFKCKYNTPMELINVVFRQGHEHQFAYDFDTLRFVLLRFGFSEVVHQEYGQSLMPELCLDQAVRASESLYVEGRK